MTTRRRFYELDLLRFLAAVAVMLYHYTYRGPLPDGYLSFQFPVLGPVFQYGDLGVPLFFIISGFVILMTAQKRDWAGFLVSRFTRLYPAYWFSVALTALVIVFAHNRELSVSPLQFVVNLTMLQEGLGVRHVDGVYWSLYVELIFYFWVFVAVATGLIRHTSKLLGAWLAVSIAIHVFGGLTFTHLDVLLIPRFSFYFIAGAAFFLIHQRGPSLYLGLLAFASYIMAMRLELQLMPRGEPFIVGGLITLFFLIFTAISLNWTRPFEARWAVSIGLLTYPLYLIHQNIGYVLLTELHGPIPRLWTLLIVMAIMLGASYLIASQVEGRLAPILRDNLTRLFNAIRSRAGRFRMQPPKHRFSEN